MTTLIIILSIWFSISLVMGVFAINQLGYQDRMSTIEGGYKSLYSFIKGFIGWPVLFPMGLAKSKYKCKAVHKVSTGKFVYKGK